ncbi:MAG: HAD-IA family hydrolase [Pseudomonadota bacterium]
MPTITTVLWDFGGVITSSPFEAFNRYEISRGLPTDFIRTVNSRNPDTNAWAQFERSDIDASAFSELFRVEAAALGHDVPGSDVLGLLSGEVRPVMVAALRELRQQYRIACLTNNVRSGRGPGMSADPARAAAVADVMQLFEVVVESSKVGVRKPELRFYEFACETLGIKPEEAVYLDDLGINLKPARALGMQTIKVTEPGQALGDLARVLGHPIAASIA